MEVVSDIRLLCWRGREAEAYFALVELPFRDATIKRADIGGVWPRPGASGISEILLSDEVLTDVRDRELNSDIEAGIPL